MNTATHACHNCRRQRLRCDKSLPQCHKCLRKRQECLGYGALFRWEKGIASRGKMMGMTFQDMELGRAGQALSPRPDTTALTAQDVQILPAYSQPRTIRTLADPLLQDMDHTSRKYMSYFASEVCKNLVVYDDASHNLFRDLIPLSAHYKILQHIIIANSALHMANASSKSSISDMASPQPQVLGKSPLSSALNSSATREPKSHLDALAARQGALVLLKTALEELHKANIDVILAVILLFIEFELIDSGRDTWKWHIAGARKILDALNKSSDLTDLHQNPLRSFLISNYLIFDILGSTITSSNLSSEESFRFIQAPAFLELAEANSCLSCPAILLQLMRSGAHLSQSRHDPSNAKNTISHQVEQIRLLLHIAELFDPLAWATALQASSPREDLEYRSHVASAHQAAVQIYLSRILVSISPAIELEHDFESLSRKIVNHLSQIPPDNALFKATVWPTFIVGAEATSPARQAWVVARLGELWQEEPWDLIRSASSLLQIVWQRRSTLGPAESRKAGWIQEIKSLGVDYLIL